MKELPGVLVMEDKLNCFQIVFPNSTAIVIKVKANIEDIAEVLKRSKGCRGYGGVVYNPNHFIYIAPLMSPTDRQLATARTFEEVFIL
jgi:hypothetical protein